MSEKKEKPAGGTKANQLASQQVKKPYKRPVLYVIGKIGQIISNN